MFLFQSHCPFITFTALLLPHKLYKCLFINRHNILPVHFPVALATCRPVDPKKGQFIGFRNRELRQKSAAVTALGYSIPKSLSPKRRSRTT